MAIETASKIKLISKAAVLIGEQPVETLNDDRYAGAVGANLFEILYEAELQSNRWRFAMQKRALSRLVDEPLNEWQYAYQIPVDCLLVVGTYPRSQYEIYGDRVYTNASAVEMDYMFKPDADKVPAYFSLLMVYCLARDMVKAITESDSAVDIFNRKYIMQRDRALFADAQARPSKPIVDSPFTDGR
jgi:hypothetical protein